MRAGRLKDQRAATGAIPTVSGRVFSAVFAALATIATIARRLAASASAVAPGAPFEGLLTGLLAWCLRRDVTRQDRQHAGEMNLVWLPGRELANASLGLSGDSWDLTLWGKNVLDKKYVSNSLFIIQFGSYTPGFGERATAGVTFNWRL